MRQERIRLRRITICTLRGNRVLDKFLEVINDWTLAHDIHFDETIKTSIESILSQEMVRDLTYVVCPTSQLYLFKSQALDWQALTLRCDLIDPPLSAMIISQV